MPFAICYTSVTDLLKNRPDLLLICTAKTNLAGLIVGGANVPTVAPITKDLPGIGLPTQRAPAALWQHGQLGDINQHIGRVAAAPAQVGALAAN